MRVIHADKRPLVPGNKSYPAGEYLMSYTYDRDLPAGSTAQRYMVK
jgi:hypothetical protein